MHAQHRCYTHRVRAFTKVKVKHKLADVHCAQIRPRTYNRPSPNTHLWTVYLRLSSQFALRILREYCNDLKTTDKRLCFWTYNRNARTTVETNKQPRFSTGLSRTQCINPITAGAKLNSNFKTIIKSLCANFDYGCTCTYCLHLIRLLEFI
jgi:hypothetical protein